MRREFDVAVEAARAAGGVLLEGLGRAGEVRYKGEVDLVTEIDEASERLLKERLLGAFPGYGLLAEESGQIAGKRDVRWVVDPLDGTVNFAHGLPVFAVSIALQRGREVVLGVVYDPVRDELFAARRGEGATLNGEPMSTSSNSELIRALVATGFPYDRTEMPEALELFGRFAARTRGMRRLGSSALDLCYVACGRLDGYYERGIWAWDVAAGALILEEAGGRVTDYRGGTLDLEGREIVASNGPLHDAMLEVTRGFSGAQRISRST
ncbi:Inositol-1-monophosphatase [Rubrobacter xylanophilus DSM 9941]|uniref:inositol monophosphatase family protein n=1 Tax=Rubrobacter xylanophilus TaxID=49319 RepID=UPI001C63CBC1|nr:inositol monophosphatase family protein [Rubrobacter xylanophilus]QYJ14780.1 Inositol-1-monophosphatase [Rubrobacter xylanophilus DSM 9941]